MDTTKAIEKALDDRDLGALVEYHTNVLDSVYYVTVYDKVMRDDDISLLSFLYKSSFPICYITIQRAFKYNALKCMKFMLDKSIVCSSYLNNAVETSLEMANLFMNKFETRYSMNRVIPYACDLNTAKYLIEEKGLSVENNTIEIAISIGKLDLLPYLISKHPKIEDVYLFMLNPVVMNHELDNRLDIAKYLIKLGAKYGYWHGEIAANNGYLDLVKFFHQNGYKICNTTYSNYDDVDDYLHEHKLGVYRTCYSGCERCYNKKMNDIIEDWYMESLIYDNLIQWLPREMLEDTIELSQVSFNNSYKQRSMWPDYDEDLIEKFILNL